MHVLFIRGFYDPARDAASRALDQLAGELTVRGVDVTVRTDARSQGRRRLPGPLRRALFMIRATWCLCRQRHQLVVVTLEEPTGLGLVVRAANALRRLSRRPLHGHVSWLMDLFTLQRVNLSRQGKTAPRRLDGIRLLLDRSALSQADRVVVLGDCMAQVARSLLGTDRIEVVPIWQPADELVDGDGAPLREAWGVERDRFVVLYSGHLNYRHPVDALLAAADRLAGDGITFLFVGDGARFDDLAEASARSPMSNVLFRRKPAGVPIKDVLAAGDVHLVALEEEATGTCVPSKTYAAMAAGKPVVYLGSASGQAAMDVVDAGAGYVVAPDDAGRLAELLRRLHADRGLRDELALHGKAFFSAERDLPVVAAQWRSLLADVDAGR